MGRKRTKNTDLPPGMRRRVWNGGRALYYFDNGSKPRTDIPLGSDYALAVKKWAELATGREPVHVQVTTFRYVAEKYLLDKITTLAPKTQREYLANLATLYKFFDDPPAPLDSIEPQHVRQYLTWRKNTPKSANREKAVLSLVWNFARDAGYTAKPNPCAGVRNFKEPGRTIYVSDEALAAVKEAASVPLQEAIDLAYLTGQRPSDVRGLSETAKRDGALELRQRKTGTPLRIAIVGELAALLDRIKARKAAMDETTVRSLAILVDEKGRALSAGKMRGAFDRARDAAAEKHPALADQIRAFQFRDLRAKAGTDKNDSAGLRSAQKQLGHGSVTMTEHYVRNRRGEKVDPTK